MVRFAKQEDLERVNELRKQVHAVHAVGRPDIFRENFNEELRDHVVEYLNDEDKLLIVAERDGVICGFACVTLFDRPQTPAYRERKFLGVEEFGVDEAMRRQGIGRELFDYIKTDAKVRGFERIELNMWEFNEGALKFYESVGFKTYRRYMEFENR